MLKTEKSLKTKYKFTATSNETCYEILGSGIWVEPMKLFLRKRRGINKC